MIVISLDEGGDFEKLSDTKCNLIGGLAFECRNTIDKEQEMKCLETFFRTVCSEQGCQYPADLHYNPNTARTGVSNRESAKKVKDALESELPDYLQMRGRWASGRPADSRYYLFCMTGDKKGLDDETRSNMRDDKAAIRYDRMIYRTIDNLLFYNPRFEKQVKYSLHLPTRVYTPDPDKKYEFRNLGYATRLVRGGDYDRNTFVVTDETGYRVAIETAQQRSGRTDLQFDLMVQSINYETHQPQQQFLYLADTLCTVYQNALHGINSNAKALPALAECGKALVGEEQTLLWAYHQADVQWQSIWDNYKHGNWFDALSTASEISGSRGSVEKVYQKTWIHWFEGALVSSPLDLRRIRAMEDALNRLDDYMQDMQKRQQSTGLYIIDQLKKCHEGIGNPALREPMDYKIAKIMTALYNHRGDYWKAEEEYKKCIEAARYVPIEEYLGVQLLYIVCLCDASEYERAEQLAGTVLAQHEMLNKLKANINPENKLIPDSYGRALSQHAQALTLLKKYDKAIEEFDKALEIFENRKKDWFMTGSYQLHALIEKGDWQEYKKASKEYFGSDIPAKQYEAIIKGECGKIPFALYVFLKGLWVFTEISLKSEFVKKIIDETEARIKEAKPEHPWEQTAKYCAFLWHRYFETNTDTSRSGELMELNRTILTEAEGVLQIIKAENEKQYHNVLNDENYLNRCTLFFTYC